MLSPMRQPFRVWPLVLCVLGLTGLVACSSGPERKKKKPKPKPTPAPSATPTPGIKALSTQGLLVPGEIQEIFDNTCVGCHGHAGKAGLSLRGPKAYGSLVERASTQLPKMLLVAPGEPEQSYLLHKVSGSHLEVGGHGTIMPARPWGGVSKLSEVSIAVLTKWIKNGAPAGE